MKVWGDVIIEVEVVSMRRRVYELGEEGSFWSWKDKEMVFVLSFRKEYRFGDILILV